MTNEEAVNVLEDMKVKISIPKAAELQRKRNESIDMAIEALNNSEIPNSSDVISRQAAIDAIYDHEYKKDMRKAIEILPSVTPQEPKTGWIPCSERMPDEHEWLGTKRFGTTKSDEVYVTFENPKGERFTRHLSFQNGKLSISDQHTIDAFYKGSVPIAWMPLPEPYREANDD